ncbi:DMSO/selenate family reductase complex A subunit [Tessaracoccus sp. MC1756]|uniref:DMSO/selenate family reductase complex A subunit n=1 Tax=Tessaracoccus sp. MC1756 TaxID=2760311 RepID=UPI0016046B17|nr:DMSO/selenate family reductase complex A subunit [Tessaracoccus sp. MC1756]MBB1509662.1 molybdopterin-dependent oxidoreductase [Tessaracoccus sp. MC1756]
MTELRELAQEVGSTALNRRSFVTWSTVVGGSAALTACGTGSGDTPPAADPEAETHVWSACTVNCGSRCPLRMVVKDGTIVRIDPDNTGDDELGTQQIRACVRGRSMRQRIYSPDRLTKPLKRVGKRGEDKWEEISWDEAFTLVADKLKALIAQYGNESIYLNYGTGVIGATIATSWPPRATAIARLMNCVGGYLDHYNDYSAGNIETAVDFHYGYWQGSNSNDDTVNSRLVVMFGNNPHETRMSGGGEVFVTRKAKELSGHKVIVIDPRQSETAMNLADEWVPIRPGTDAALVAGMAHVMISEGLHDKAFLDTYCSGFDEEHMPEGAPANMSYESYIMGKSEDGVEKTPEWAAQVTGYPADKIRALAREIATTKPCAVNAGWGIQRHSNGENQSRAPMMLAALIGQIGIPGGGTGERESSANIGMGGFPVLENPVRPVISFYRWTDAILEGKGWGYQQGVRDLQNLNGNANVKHDITLNSNIKFIWNYGSNALINQHGDINRTIEILSDETLCEMIVVIDNQMTVSARYADLVLPDVTTAEQSDIIQQGSAGNLGYSIFASRAIEPIGDSMPIYDQLTGIAEKLGVKDKFTEGRTQDQWLDWILDQSRSTSIPDLPPNEEFKKMGIFRKTLEPVIGMKAFREDPVANPLTTPSGRIEIFSSNLYAMSLDWEMEEGNKIDPLPVYWQSREMPGDPLQATYPLQCIGHHYKARTHSSYGNSPWLKEAHPQNVWVNDLDAKRRGISNGDQVRVFNDRGATVLPAFVTKRIMPGVISVPQGAWYKPDRAGGTDTGGSVNILTSHHPTPYAKANGQHSALVQIERA